MSLAQALTAVERRVDDLYATVLTDGTEVLFRLPCVKKVQQYSLLLDAAEDYSFHVIIYEHLFKNFVEDSWLRDAEDIPAGIVETIAKLILHLSGMGEDSKAYTEELLSANRLVADEVLIFMQRTICSCFPSYTFELLDSLSYTKIVSIFTQAEKVLMERGIIASEYFFQDPEEEQKKGASSLHDQIRRDQNDYREFDTEAGPDPRMQELRRQSIERAAEEERKYLESIGG